MSNYNNSCIFDLYEILKINLYLYQNIHKGKVKKLFFVEYYDW